MDAALDIGSSEDLPPAFTTPEELEAQAKAKEDLEKNLEPLTPETPESTETPEGEVEPTETSEDEDDLLLDDDLVDLDDESSSDDGEEDPNEAFSEEELEELRKDDSKAVEQAREKGKLAKKLQAEVDAVELERDRLMQENAALQDEIKKQSESQIDPMSHPDFQKKQNSTRSSILRQARSLPFQVDEAHLASNWGFHPRSPEDDRRSPARRRGNPSRRPPPLLGEEHEPPRR